MQGRGPGKAVPFALLPVEVLDHLSPPAAEYSEGGGTSTQGPSELPFSSSLDYHLDLNHSEAFPPTTTFLPEDFTYFANHPCPERLPSMSK